jgi:hypothetical protein
MEITFAYTSDISVLGKLVVTSQQVQITKCAENSSASFRRNTLCAVIAVDDIAEALLNTYNETLLLTRHKRRTSRSWRCATDAVAVAADDAVGFLMIEALLTVDDDEVPEQNCLVHTIFRYFPVPNFIV